MTTRDNELYMAQKMARSKSTLTEINNLLQFQYYNNTINRLYYASFYAVQALLCTVDIYPKSHKGMLLMLTQHFIQTKKSLLQTLIIRIAYYLRIILIMHNHTGG